MNTAGLGLKNSLKQTQQLKQIQKLVMTQEMRLKIEMLQKTNLDLREYVLEELSMNPFLEVDDWGDAPDINTDDNFESESADYTKDLTSELKNSDDGASPSDMLASFDWETYSESNGTSYSDMKDRKKNDYNESVFSYEDVVAGKETLQSHLDNQINVLNIDDKIKEIMVYMCYNLDKMGFLRETDEDISLLLGVSQEDCETARYYLGQLDPEGAASIDFREYLFFMFSEKKIADLSNENRELILQFLENDKYGDFLISKDYLKIEKSLGISRDVLRNIIQDFKKIRPYPAFGFDVAVAQPAIPDMRVFVKDGDVIIEMDNKMIPVVSVNDDMFYREFSRLKDSSSKEFLKDRYRMAQQLIKSLSDRNKTLYEVANSIFGRQKLFLELGDDFLRPMNLKDVADDIGKHPSTVSRLTNGKFAITPQGVYELKSLFVKQVNEKVSTTNRHLESRIIDIIAKEDKKAPLSDDDIAHALKKEGINVARRTVAKYRDKLGIFPARERKKNYEFEFGG